MFKAWFYPGSRVGELFVWRRTEAPTLVSDLEMCLRRGIDILANKGTHAGVGRLGYRVAKRAQCELAAVRIDCAKRRLNALESFAKERGLFPGQVWAELNVKQQGFERKR
jgi:hypothetical protein